jgi:hypothetical protein
MGGLIVFARFWIVLTSFHPKTRSGPTNLTSLTENQKTGNKRNGTNLGEAYRQS